jgi:hypothetical protein
VNWSLSGCARTGHVTCAPDEPGLRDRLMAPADGGTAWRCLRCGAFVTGGQHDSGPAAAAPLLRRGPGTAQRAAPARIRGGPVPPPPDHRRRGLRVWRFTYDRPASSGHSTTPYRQSAPCTGISASTSATPGAPVYPVLVHGQLTLAHLSGHRAGCGRADRAGGKRRAGLRGQHHVFKGGSLR